MSDPREGDIAAADPRRGRALAALHGLAIGDALGMPTQLMSRAEIAERFGEITDFAAGASDHPIAADMAAGSITDDTEQALLVADLLVATGGEIPPGELAAKLVAWEDRMRARGSLDLLGPSTRAAVAAVLAGTPADQAGRAGTTNGAAMRITPVGIATGTGDLGAFVTVVQDAGRVSHDTGIAIAGAAAIAAVVSAGLDGADWDEAVQLAVAAAHEGATRGHWIAGADVASRILWAMSLAEGGGAHGLDDMIALIGTSLATQESVPAAFGMLALARGGRVSGVEDRGGIGWTAALLAANAGGDTDTIAALAGAMAGALAGADAFPASAVAAVTVANPDHLASARLERLVADLLAVRDSRE